MRVGLLAFETNRGAFVPTLNAEGAEENYALRRSIEPQLLRRSIAKMSIVDLAEAEVTLDTAASSITESNWHFHKALYAASGWDRGMAIAEMLHAAVAPYVLLYTEVLGGAPESSDEHREMLDLCRKGQSDRAVAVLESHLDGASRTLVEFLEDGEAQQ